MITVTVLRLFVCVFFIFMETVSVRLFDCLSQAVTDRQTDEAQAVTGLWRTCSEYQHSSSSKK